MTRLSLYSNANRQADYAPDLVSVVIPARNAAATVAQTVESVLAQSWPEVEAIVVDDGSTDGTADALAGFDDRVTVLRNQPAEGVSNARNRALDRACGRYVAFVDADDYWAPEKLELQVTALRQSDAVMSHTGYVQLVDGQRSAKHPVSVPARVGYLELLRTNHIMCSSAMIDRGRFGRVQFDPPIREDYKLWLRVLRESGSYSLGVDRPLVYYRNPEMTRLLLKKLKKQRGHWAVYRESEQLSVPTSAWLIASHWLGALRRHI